MKKTTTTRNLLEYRYPFTPFPKGWYRVGRSSGLKPGEMKVVRFFGLDLVLQRAVSGEVSLTHSTGHLAVVEKNELIFAFFDENGGEPFFEVPEVPQFRPESKDQWHAPFNLSWKVRVHVQEVAENALDLSHFCVVHTYQDIPTLSRFDIYDHQFRVTMHSRRNIFGFISKTSMDIIYFGMGIVVSDVRSNQVNLTVLLTTTPIDIETVEINMEISINKTCNPIRDGFYKMLLPQEIAKEFYHDIPVWEAKVYRSKPLLCRNETNITRIRNWARQFYGLTVGESL